jgi:outer membrane protein
VRRLTLVLACCVVPLAAASQQQRSVTLAEAIALAVRADPAVVQAEGSARLAGASVRSTWGEFLPRIGSTATYGKSFSSLPSRTDPLTGEVISGNVTTGSLNVGANASLDLFTGFRRGADLNAARANLSDADASLADARAQSALRTSNQFIQTLQTADLVRVQQDAIRRAEDKLAIANAKLATRAATIADSLGAVVDVARARAQLLTQQRNLTEAEATLARLVGFDGRVSAVADSSLFQVTVVSDTAALMTEAMSRSPAVISAEAKVRSARAQVGIYKSVYWPSLLLSGSTSLNGSSQSSYDLSSTRGFNLGVSWNLFNGFVRERNLVQAHANHDAAQATAANARRVVGAGLTTQLAALSIAEQRIALTAMSLDAARASARVQTERYRLGSIGIIELNLAQDALSNAETEAINARYEYLRAKAQIEAILGRQL